MLFRSERPNTPARWAAHTAKVMVILKIRAISPVGVTQSGKHRQPIGLRDIITVFICSLLSG